MVPLVSLVSLVLLLASLASLVSSFKSPLHAHRLSYSSSSSSSSSISKNSSRYINRTPLSSSSLSSPPITEGDAEESVITISDRAKSHLKALTEKQGGAMCLRMGVRAGGCSGMSYVMDFVSEHDITGDDHIEEYLSLIHI